MAEKVGRGITQDMLKEAARVNEYTRQLFSTLAMTETVSQPNDKPMATPVKPHGHLGDTPEKALDMEFIPD